ncbi:CAP-GLY domain-containing linker protein 1 [Terramyces sp. JEL0728]|nr:CAP-GLY domain-containing linker protein 1 [Terramyces sp. JEL0728]
MGAGVSQPELKDRELERLGTKYGLNKEGLRYFYNHYGVLQAKINDPAELENRWLIEKLFAELFPDKDKLSFSLYLETLMNFKSQSLDERAQFYFKIIDYDKDKVINQSDITVFLQQISNYKFAVGDRVRVTNNNERAGTLSFLGKTEFAKGKWAGGKNNGSVNGVKYFECQPNYGVFIQHQFLESEMFHKSSLTVLKAFDATTSITFDQFKQKINEDKWLNSRVMFDPVKQQYLK